jgi:glycosyltransferase involved in cell wall biosynthesis
MKKGLKIAVIIPAINEEPSIGKVIAAIPDWVDDVIVADNGSTDRTPEIAREAGARVIPESRRGYGSACLAAIAALDTPDVVVFLDGDFSDYPEEMPLLVDPIAGGAADMVIGSRTIGKREPGALTPQALFGNWLSCALIRWFWSVSYSDLGPFRAIRHETLKKLSMQDRDYGWTVEMQIKAAREGARILEVPVSYRALRWARFPTTESKSLASGSSYSRAIPSQGRLKRASFAPLDAMGPPNYTAEWPGTPSPERRNFWNTGRSTSKSGTTAETTVS